MENQMTPSLDKGHEIEWTHYNYPPLIRIIHYVPSEITPDRKFIVLSLFALHIASLAVCLLNFIDNFIQGGLGILYSLLFAFIFVPLLFFLFYKGMTGVCRAEASLKWFFILQPIAAVLEVIGAIVDFLGFNGFIRVSELFKEGRGGAGALALIVSLLLLAMAAYSAFIVFIVCRKRTSLKLA